ncbi:MAG TPA: 16S rRNA (uracil(1498)-N(3))-methyltransferase [Burkholderiaceae bacterium]|nr:16S rRNA (uracil(1498)-N(3))-methyltransferase [Burkholderiaceae bacterium]
MTSPRFYCPAPIAPNQTMALPADLAHHAIRVLRLASGTPVVLFDGRGGQYPARLVIDGKTGVAEIGARQEVEAELAGELILVQGIVSGDKMDWIIEKAVELGASRLVPVAARRSVPLLKGERLEKRRLRWARIVQAASEQCGRNRLMHIDAPRTLDDYLGEPGAPAPDQILCCHPDADRALSQTLAPTARRIALLVGPEGGWSDDELAVATAHQAQPVRFGTRVLRTETAGLALLTAVATLKGWQ